MSSTRPLVDHRDIPSQPSRQAPCALPDTPLAKMRPGIDACVHCGFCLQSCPTYLTLEDENDSPRGRILLMRSALEGSLALDDPSLETHIDRCLGCRACETVCPSGVPYGHLLEATRATMAEKRRLPVIARAILWVFARPALLTMAMAMSRMLRATRIPVLLSPLRGRLGFAMAMLASTESRDARASYVARGDGSRGRTALLLGCVMEGLLTETNRATERTLTVNGYSMVDAPGQKCCGALHAHAGDLTNARELARANIAAFEQSGAEYICANAAGCGAMMKEYAHLLADDSQWSERAARFSPRVRDVSELLVAAGPSRGGPLPVKVTYDAPCHLLHAQRIADPPLVVLRSIPQLELVPLAGAEHCCGAAGIYNLVEPETSNTVLAPKVHNIDATGAALVATGNPGCLMQIGAGLRRASSAARVVHPVDLLDRSYARLGTRD
ncbi:MAG TPA: heterodisulfide reductase-related iron-sulfur binding cluster [Gemmatimonadaceae bacterium]|nr:heterodisulfide reductase-related iron-sulfur binding cluster [Gemmatimonadaceae bacterium]